jgi:hypothetical protein
VKNDAIATATILLASAAGLSQFHDPALILRAYTDRRKNTNRRHFGIGCWGWSCRGHCQIRDPRDSSGAVSQRPVSKYGSCVGASFVIAHWGASEAACTASKSWR